MPKGEHPLMGRARRQFKYLINKGYKEKDAAKKVKQELGVTVWNNAPARTT